MNGPDTAAGRPGDKPPPAEPGHRQPVQMEGEQRQTVRRAPLSAAPPLRRARRRRSPGSEATARAGKSGPEEPKESRGPPGRRVAVASDASPAEPQVRSTGASCGFRETKTRLARRVRLPRPGGSQQLTLGEEGEVPAAPWPNRRPRPPGRARGRTGAQASGRRTR